MTELPPPALNDIGSYESWRSEIQMWQITTTMEPKRQALAVRTKLCDKAREVALKLDAADLNNESGMLFLIDALDASFRKKVKKWDVTASAKSNSKDNGQSKDLSATDKAKQRAAELNAKLTAEGKVVTPAPTPPKAPTLPSQLKKVLPLTSLTPAALLPAQSKPEVKKMENGNSFAEFVINDVAARPFLTRLSTRDLIAQKSGTNVSLRGRFLTEDEKRRAAGNVALEKPLVLMIQANVAAKVQVALHKIAEVIRVYEAVGPENNFNNYGLSSTDEPSANHHFVQHKLWVGLEHIHPDFNLKIKLAGENGTNFTFMVQQTGAKVFLRGKGSGYLEPSSGRESFEALHIYISHPRQDGLDMAVQLCESLIETVKVQYDEWNTQRIAPPAPNPSYPSYPTYPPTNNGYTVPSYGPISVLQPQPHTLTLPLSYGQETRVPIITATHDPETYIRPITDYRETSGNPPMPTDYRAAGDYRQMFSQTQTPICVLEPRPRVSQPFSSVNEVRPPESNFNAGGLTSAPQSRDRDTGEHDPFDDTNERDRKSDRSRRTRSRSQEDEDEDVGRSAARSPSPGRKSSRSRESRSKSKGQQEESPNHRESSPTRRHFSPDRRTSSPTRRDSPPRRFSPDREDRLSAHRDSPTRRRDSPSRRRDLYRRDSSPDRQNSPFGHRDSPPGRQDRQDDSPNRWHDIYNSMQLAPSSRVDSPNNRVDSPNNRVDSPSSRVDSPTHRMISPLERQNVPPVTMRESPLARRESPPSHEEKIQPKSSPPKERPKRKFTEEPKKRRKFSEDPRLIEQAKVQMLMVDRDKRAHEKTIVTYPSLESLNEKCPAPKLQFRSRKESPPMNDSSRKPKSILKMAPPCNLPMPPKRNGLLKSVKISPSGHSKRPMQKDDAIFEAPPPIATFKAPQQKALNMGALGSLAMYDDDSDDD